MTNDTTTQAVADAYGLSLDEAAAVHAILERGPTWTGCHESFDVRDWLNEADALIPGTHGVECFNAMGTEYSYLNAGDTYDATLIVDVAAGRVFISSWGDVLESAENEHTEETGEVRCGYCGEWNEVPDGTDWHDVTCSACDNGVAG